MSATQDRVRCPRCLRAESVCWCKHLPVLEARTRVLILQHPRERDVAIGTARMAHLALPGSELRIGTDFSKDPVVAEALRGPAYLLYPGPDAVDIETFAPPGPITLVLVDGTWSNARKLVRRNPCLLALPQLRFTPLRPGEYRIRREPAAHCVATIEALAHVLGRLEGDPARFEALLTPFRAMVDTQILHSQGELSGRRGKQREGLSAPWRALARLADQREHLVCVQGEASAWPMTEPGGHPPEIVQWLAVRVATGERFDATIAPRGVLAPATPYSLDIPAETLVGGESFASFAARWRAFVRPDDVIASWRTFGADVLDREDPALVPARRVDLRPLASRLYKGPTGSLADWLARVGEPLPEPWAPGRGGRRIAALEAAVRRLLVLASGTA